MKLPRDVECPFCRAPAGHVCVSRKQRSYPAATHKARWLSVGITDNIDRNYLADWRYESPAPALQSSAADDGEER